jgi:hypothetical protein
MVDIESRPFRANGSSMTTLGVAYACALSAFVWEEERKGSLSRLRTSFEVVQGESTLECILTNTTTRSHGRKSSRSQRSLGKFLWVADN